MTQAITLRKLESRLEDLQKKIARLEGSLQTNQVQAGRTLHQLRQMFKHGSWMPYSEKLYKRLGISRKTGERYIESYEIVAGLGNDVVKAAQKSGIKLTRINDREIMREIKEAHPTASPTEIVKMTNLKLQKPKPVVEIHQVVDLTAFITTVTRLRFDISQLSVDGADPEQVRTAIRVLRELSRSAADAATKLERAA